MLRTTSLLVTVLLLVPTVVFAQGSVDLGQKVYAAEKCSVCHSIAGKGNKRGTLDGVAGKLSEDELHQWVVNAAEMTARTKSTRKPVMKSYAHLSKADADALVDYLQTLKK